MNEIIVVGGGTAGWLAALYCNHFAKDFNVTVIESTHDIIGAGEGTVPQFVEALEMLDISPMHLITETHGTIKQGIKFTDWNSEKGSYDHMFCAHEEINHNPCNVSPSLIPIHMLHGISKDIPVSETIMTSHLNAKGKAPFYFEDDDARGTVKTQAAPYALHFNARLLADFLKEKARERGVNWIQDDIIDIEKDEKGNIKKLVSDSRKYGCDFVYDCTGFSRVIISKMNAKWIPAKKTVDTAIPFVVFHGDTTLPSYTESIAMKHGWMWVIPTLDRYGCGYTYDSDCATEDEIKQEILEKFPDAKIPGKVISFESGYYETPWVNNCIAAGLSAGFIEPLEATSILSTTQQLLESLISPVYLLELCQKRINHYNNDWCNMSSEIHEFVYMHYCTDRDDTPFWRQFKKNEDCVLFINDYLTSVFGIPSRLQVMQGINSLDEKMYKKIYNSMNMSNKNIDYLFDKWKQILNDVSDNCVPNSYEQVEI